jgi:hypothetical protein
VVVHAHVAWEGRGLGAAEVGEVRGSGEFAGWRPWEVLLVVFWVVESDAREGERVAEECSQHNEEKWKYKDHVDCERRRE